VIQENVFGAALTQLDAGKTDGEGAWNEAIQLLNELVVKD